MPDCVDGRCSFPLSFPPNAFRFLMTYAVLRTATLIFPDVLTALLAILAVLWKGEEEKEEFHRSVTVCLFIRGLEGGFDSKLIVAATAVYVEKGLHGRTPKEKFLELAKEATWVGLSAICVWFSPFLLLQEAACVCSAMHRTERRSAALFPLLELLPLPVVYGEEATVRGNATAMIAFAAGSQTEFEEKYRKLTLKPQVSACKSLSDTVNSLLQSPKAREVTVGRTETQGETWEWTLKLLGNERQWLLFGANVTVSLRFEESYRREAAAKSALVRSFSHEVLTPLNSIMYLCSEIQGKSEVASILKTNCCLLQYVLSDVIDYAEILSSQLEIAKADFRLRPSVNHLISLFSYQIQKKGLSLTVSIDPLIPEVVYSDERKLGQVFLNLLSNAVKHTLRGEITVDICLVDTGQMRVQVADSGCGVSEPAIKKLFSMNNLADTKGAGIGLYVSSLIAKKLGSRRIYVRSKLGEGATFWIEVDIMRQRTASSAFVFSPTVYWDAKDASAIPRPLCSNIQSMDLKSLNIQTAADVLIVDDNEFNRTILRMMLKKMKITCDEAASGRTAIDAVLRAGKFTYKLIIMDVEMPEIDGIDATKRLFCKQSAGEIDTLPPIIALTAYPSYQIKEKCMEAGMTQFLSKPVSMEQLRGVVEKYCPQQC